MSGCQVKSIQRLAARRRSITTPTGTRASAVATLIVESPVVPEHARAAHPVGLVAWPKSRPALAYVIVGRAYAGAWTAASGIELRLGRRDHAAIGAHLERLEPPIRAAVHPVLPGELGGHALDRALHSERLAAANAVEWHFLLEDTHGRGGGVEVEPRLERDHLLGTGRLAPDAL